MREWWCGKHYVSNTILRMDTVKSNVSIVGTVSLNH